MILIHKSKFDYTIDGKLTTGYKAVFLNDRGYEVVKLSKECYEANHRFNTKYVAFYDKYARVIKLEERR